MLWASPRLGNGSTSAIPFHPQRNLAETALIANLAGELLGFSTKRMRAFRAQCPTCHPSVSERLWGLENGATDPIWKKPSDPLAHVYEVDGGQHYCTAYGAWDISE